VKKSKRYLYNWRRLCSIDYPFNSIKRPFTCKLIYRTRTTQLESLELKPTTTTEQGELILSPVQLALCLAAALKAMLAHNEEFDTVSAHMRLCASQPRVKPLYILEPIIEFLNGGGVSWNGRTTPGTVCGCKGPERPPAHRIGDCIHDSKRHRLPQLLAPPALHETLLGDGPREMRVLRRLLLRHARRSRRVTNTLSRPTSSSVHDIALQRTIGMGGNARDRDVQVQHLEPVY
jgi:hypothetical protein